MSQNERTLTESATDLANKLHELAQNAADLAVESGQNAPIEAAHNDPFIISGLSVFVLACIVGYYVVWRVTPALHSPLMGLTNAISSVVIVGALMALAPVGDGFSLMGFLGVIFASINIFGGFIITRRMLHMFKKKDA